MEYANQHYVPVFLLKQWETGADKKLTYFRRMHTGKVGWHRCSARAAGKERHLYSILRSAPMPDVRIEKGFMGPSVDDPASVVHAKLLKGVDTLSVEDRLNWVPFLVSLLLRTPAKMEYLRQRGQAVLAEGLDKAPDDYLALRGDEPEATLRLWVEKNMPHVFDDLGTLTLPRLIFSKLLNEALLNVTWVVRTVTASRWNFLISDSPLTLVGGLKEKFLVALPISPTKMFMAFNDDETYRRVSAMPGNEFVKAANISAIRGSSTYVYATDTVQSGLVEKWLVHGSPSNERK